MAGWWLAGSPAAPPASTSPSPSPAGNLHPNTLFIRYDQPGSSTKGKEHREIKKWRKERMKKALFAFELSPSLATMYENSGNPL
jgi:hypothetical protein